MSKFEAYYEELIDAMWMLYLLGDAEDAVELDMRLTEAVCLKAPGWYEARKKHD